MGKELTELVVATGTGLLDPTASAPPARPAAGRGRRHHPLPDQGALRVLERHRPIDASSGDPVRHRLSRAGNRQINRVLHIMARGQIRNPSQGRD